MELGGSFGLCRSHGSVLLSESVTSECARITGYERLSKSMRLSGEIDFSDERPKRKRGFGILSKVFAFRRMAEGPERPEVEESQTVEKKQKKRCSWLPDPERRWPIQGW